MLLEIAGRQRPIALAWMDRTAAQQELAVPGHDGADDELRIVVAYEAAFGTDRPRQGIPGVNLADPRDTSRSFLLDAEHRLGAILPRVRHAHSSTKRKHPR